MELIIKSYLSNFVGTGFFLLSMCTLELLFTCLRSKVMSFYAYLNKNIIIMLNSVFVLVKPIWIIIGKKGVFKYNLTVD